MQSYLCISKICDHKAIHVKNVKTIKLKTNLEKITQSICITKIYIKKNSSTQIKLDITRKYITTDLKNS